MSEQAIFELNAVQRNDIGKGASRRLRRADYIPGILYGANKEAISLSFEQRSIKKALAHEPFYSHILTIKVDGKTEKAVLKAVQRHPFKPKVLHLDFMRISATEKLTMQVPFHFLGEEVAPGVKEGGIISHHLINAEISCLPGDLPEYIEVDISNLEMDKAIHLSEITAPKGVEFVALTHDNDQAVVSIHMPRIVEEEEPEAEGEEKAAAPEEEGKASEEKPAEGEEKKEGKKEE